MKTTIDVNGLARAEFRALGTGATVLTEDPADLPEAVRRVRSKLAAIDKACSRFRSDSELEAANRAAGRPVSISRLLGRAIEISLRAARLTDGDVDPTIGAALRGCGYDRDFARIQSDGVTLPNGAPIVTLTRVRGWKQVSYDSRHGLLQVPAGISLDLGATAKAWAADESAAAAFHAVRKGVLVSLGGDIATAGPAPDGGWRIRVTDWHGSPVDAPGQTVSIEAGGLATSSTTVRRWTKGGVEMHHILNPATGRPVDVVWRTVSVAACDCVDANVASTAAIIRGERAPAWLEESHLAARLVRPSGATLAVAGWPSEAKAA